MTTVVLPPPFWQNLRWNLKSNCTHSTLCILDPEKARPHFLLLLQIQQMWSEVLGIGPISCSANFFQIGGNSLLGTMLASRLQSSLHIQVPAAQLFISRTISELASFVSQCQPSPSDDSPSCGQAAGATPPPQLSAAQKAQGVYCTLNQEVMVLSHQLCPRPSAFSMPFAVRLRGPLNVGLLDTALRLAISRQEVLLCHLTGKLVTKGSLARALRRMLRSSLISNKMVQGLLSNALVAKMIQKRMQGRAGLGTKMVLPLIKPQVAPTLTQAFALCALTSPTMLAGAITSPR